MGSPMCASQSLVTMLLTIVIILASSVSLVTSAHSWRHAAINPSNPGQCVDLDTQLSHEINQPWETGECELSTCIQFSDTDVRILDERCSPVEPPSDPRDCVLTHGDEGREYPFCCPQVVCL